MWGERQHTELVKRQALAKKRRVDAILHGSCPAGDDDGMADVVKYVISSSKRDCNSFANTPLTGSHPGPPHEVLPVGARVFLLSPPL